jgi:hypothetical protein
VGVYVVLVAAIVCCGLLNGGLAPPYKQCGPVCAPYVYKNIDNQCYCLTESGDYRLVKPLPEEKTP